MKPDVNAYSSYDRYMNDLCNYLEEENQSLRVRVLKLEAAKEDTTNGEGGPWYEEYRRQNNKNN